MKTNLLTQRAKILTVLKINKKSGITKKLCAELGLGFCLGEHIRQLKIQGNNIIRVMERNYKTQSRFARYLLI